MNRNALVTAATLFALTALVAGVFAAEVSLLYGQRFVSAYLTQFVRWGVWALFLPLIAQLARLVPFTKGNLLRLAAIHSVTALVLGLAHFEISVHLPSPLWFSNEDPFVMVFSWEIVNYFQLAILCYAVHFADSMKMRALESSRLEGEIARLRLQALQSQLQPEYLLEALGRIPTLLKDDAEKADRAIVTLGDFIRSKLDGLANTQWFLEKPLAELRERQTLLEIKAQSGPMTKTRKALLITVIWVSINVFFLGRDVAMALLRQQVNWGVAGWIAFAWSEWALLTPPALWFAAKFPLEKPHLVSRTFLHALLSILFWLMIEILFSLGIWMSGPGGTTYISVFLSNLRAYGFMTDVITYATILAVHHAIRHHREGQQQALRVLQLQTTLLEAQLSALQMQIHPHFLFNTLHSVAELAHEDTAAAAQMISRLERFFQLTLNTSVDQQVPLEQELEFLQCYLDIQQVRFKESLTVYMEVDERSKNLLVPNLILQPIVENAIRHGTPPDRLSRAITIKTSTEAEHLKLEVRDNGPGLRKNGRFSEGLGLRNVRARLKQLYGDQGLLKFGDTQQGGLLVTVAIPLQYAF